MFNKVSNFQLRQISARQAHKVSIEPAPVLTDCTNGIISECMAQPGTSRFLGINGAGTRNLMIHTNYTRNADDTALILNKFIPKGAVIYKPFGK